MFLLWWHIYWWTVFNVYGNVAMHIEINYFVEHKLRESLKECTNRLRYSKYLVRKKRKLQFFSGSN